MAEGKKAFIVYTNWKDFLDVMTSEQKGEWISWVMDYCNDTWENDDSIEYPKDQVVCMAVKMVKPILKKDLKKYEAKVESVNKAREKRKFNNEINNENNVEINNDINTETSLKRNEISTDISNKKEVISNKKEVIRESKDSNNNISLGQNDLRKESETEKREALFERFWNVYPKKVGKEKCRKWFLSKSRKVDNDLVIKMLQSIKIWQNTKQWSNAQYIPQPYTWLNRGGWEDIPKTDVKGSFTSLQDVEIQWEEL